MTNARQPCRDRYESSPHDVALGVYVDAVRRHHDAAAEIRKNLARVTVELEDRIDRVIVAIDSTGQKCGNNCVRRELTARRRAPHVDPL